MKSATIYTATCGDASDTSNVISTMLTSSHKADSISLSLSKVPDFATASLADIVSVVNDYYNGNLSLSDITSRWQVGDTRNIDLASMSATGVGESHSAQRIQVVIIGINHDDLSTSISSKNKALLTIQTLPCLTTKGYMNTTNTNAGGWDECARRTWCNNVFANALPTEIKNVIKTVNKIASVGSMSTSLKTSQDKVFLLSENEIFGKETFSTGNEGKQYAYYSQGGSTTKNLNGGDTSVQWWERSPYVRYPSYFGIASNTSNYGASAVDFGIAPAFCL